NSLNDGECPECGEKLRPNIVFFGEAAPMYERLNAEIKECGFFVVIGTSGNVIEVNSIAAFCDYSILNNLEPSSAIAERDFSKVIYDKASNAIDVIAEDVEAFLS
ncbi:MAG: Sir2 family NAD-dependent protein deacetylase, partial [Sulfurimonas sp.]|nr:Sir2 family NAD-dependent protein deacetylase [Sulfurimonas sp.]